MSNYLNIFFVFALVLAIMSVAILPTAYAGCHPECSEFDGNILNFLIPSLNYDLISNAIFYLSLH